MNIYDLLPIGSIVRLDGGIKKLMIIGVKQTDLDSANRKEYDYLGVWYPEGYIGPEYQYLFNHNDIEEVIFKGYENPEREDFLYNLDAYYSELMQ